MIENIKMLVMDVDGTLTDGKIYYGNDGELFKAFDVRDGYRLVKCEEYGIITAIITGKTSKIVEGRARDLKIKEILGLAPWVILVFLMGFYPEVFMNKFEPTVTHYLNDILQIGATK